MDLDIKRKERKVLNSSLYSLTHRNARTIKLVSLRVRHISAPFIFCFAKIVSLVSARAGKGFREPQEGMTSPFIFCFAKTVSLFSLKPRRLLLLSRATKVTKSALCREKPKEVKKSPPKFHQTKSEGEFT